MSKTHPCSKESDIEVIKTHVLYIKDSIDKLNDKLEKQDDKFAAKKEVTLIKWALVSLTGALSTIYWFLINRA